MYCRYRCHKQHWPQPHHYVFQRFFERVVGRCEKQPGSVASTTSASLHTPMYSSFSMLLFHRSNQSTTEFSGRCLEIRSVHERNFFPCHVHREHPSHCVRGHPPRNQRMADTTTVGVQPWICEYRRAGASCTVAKCLFVPHHWRKLLVPTVANIETEHRNRTSKQNIETHNPDKSCRGRSDSIPTILCFIIFVSLSLCVVVSLCRCVVVSLCRCVVVSLCLLLWLQFKSLLSLQVPHVLSIARRFETTVREITRQPSLQTPHHWVVWKDKPGIFRVAQRWVEFVFKTHHHLAQHWQSRCVVGFLCRTR